MIGIRANRPLVFLVLVSCAGSSQSRSDPAAPSPVQTRLVAHSKTLLTHDGGRKSAWILAPDLNPDIYTAILATGERREICFVSGENSLCHTVGVGDQFDFIVSHAGIDYPTRIVGVYVPPMAVFDDAYQAEHRGKIRVSVPEVYELVNIAIALTGKARTDPWINAKESAYYQEVMRDFAHLENHSFVDKLDKELQENYARYHTLKMNAYSFEFGEGDKIVRSSIYDRTAFQSSTTNDLRPYLSEMQDFAAKSRFREFYANHHLVYQSQTDYYQNQIGLGAMLDWLRVQFPDVKPYDTINIILSPLVGANQSVVTMESNGFRELQPHVNFPYPAKSDELLSPSTVALRKGKIVFTELNHGFINPTAEHYSDRINAALAVRSHWVVSGSAADSYGSRQSVFNEMMNWALISLYLVDKCPPQELDQQLAGLDQSMGAKGRGFVQFPRFNQFLVKLYRDRSTDATVASLYPTIVEWFEAQK